MYLSCNNGIETYGGGQPPDWFQQNQELHQIRMYLDGKWGMIHEMNKERSLKKNNKHHGGHKEACSLAGRDAVGTLDLI